MKGGERYDVRPFDGPSMPDVQEGVPAWNVWDRLKKEWLVPLGMRDQDAWTLMRGTILREAGTLDKAMTEARRRTGKRLL